MQFKVPQFLEIEDKIFGPFTFKQFVYLTGGAGLCFLLYKFLGLLYGTIPILAMAGISLALAFYRPNNKPLINMIEAAFKYFIQDKLFIWQRKIKKSSSAGVDAHGKPIVKTELLKENEQKLGNSKLRDLAWSLDVLDLNKKNQ